ncbi:MAG TPA: hypothetical protein VMF14_08050 [Solirubrobacteraceae bacterium]|nr:hypothetical protein [Solirubrobacteraceae bacterium]
MPRLTALSRPLACAATILCAAVLAPAALAAAPRLTQTPALAPRLTQTPALAPRLTQTPPAGAAQARGTVVALGWSSFTIRIGGRRMSVVRALTTAADAVTSGDYPYVYGGGHAEAGTASIGIKGPGYNGRRLGFDCSGAVGAVLAGAGLLPAGMPVPNDAGVIAELRQAKLIAPGIGRGAGAVTFWDKPGVHIFMSINGRDFGTSDGGAGNATQPHGGAGWLNDGAPDAANPAFKPYHLVAAELTAPTVYGPTLTFQTGDAYDLLESVVVGDALHVSYTRGRQGVLTAATVAFAGARTLTATITAVGDDGSSVTVQTAAGQTLTLDTASPRLLDWLGVGDEVSLTYTPGAGGAPVARTIQRVQ